MRNTLIFIFILLVLSACDRCNKSENSNNDGTDSLSQQINNIPEDFKNQQYNLPGELMYGNISKEFLYDKFFPIGWSKDGKFAYIVEPADEASGNYWFELVILDIVNNKVDWSWKPAESEQGDLKTTWNNNYKLFRDRLAEAEIIQLSKFTLKSAKTEYKGNDYELILDNKTITDPDFGFEVVKEIDMTIVSEELGRKKIINQKEEEYSRVIGAIIPGFLLCPFDDRIVVVCKKERVGYEGPPNVVYFDLYGSDLMRGFKKDNES